MAAELSIAIKIGATIGGAIGAIRSILSGTNHLGASITLVQRQYDVLGRAIGQATQSGSQNLARLQRQHEQLGRSVQSLSRIQNWRNHSQMRLENARNAREQMKSEALGTFASVGAVLVPIKAAMDFESSMADVRKVVDFDTPQQFKEMEQQLLSMTHKIPMSANELAKIAASGGQLGIARQDIAGFTETVAKMSVAFDMSAEQAGDSMAKLANVYQIPIARIGRLGDAINHLSNNSPAKAGDIVNALGRVGGVAKQFGLSELQTASLANAFISLGKTPEVAGTAINGMLTKLMSADKQGNKFQATLTAMGISAQELKRDIAQNGEQALLDFLAKINQLPKDGQMGALVDLFGLEYADDVAVLAGSLDTYQKSIDALKNTGQDGKPAFAGSMEKEFAARSATTANSWQLFKNQMAHLAISIGSVMLPAINELLGSLKPLMEQLIQFTQAHPSLIKNIYLALAGFAAFKAGGLAVRFMLSGLGSIFWKTGSVMSGFFSLWARFSAAFRLFQMGRAISALRMFGLTARQAKVWIAGFTRIGSLVSGSLKRMGAAFAWAVRSGRVLISFLPMLGQAFRALGRFLLTTPIGMALGLMATAAYLLYTRWEAVVGGAKLLWQDLGYFFSQLWLNIQMFFSSGLGNIALTILNWSPVGWFYQVFAAVLNFFGVELPDSLSGFIQMLIGKLSALISAWSPIGTFHSAFTAVLGWFGITLPAQFINFGGMLIDGLVNGIKAKIGEAVQTIQNLGARIKGAFTGAMQIHSPSRVFHAYGGDITDGLAIGVNQGANKPVGKISQLAASLKTGFEAGLSGAKSRFTQRMGDFRSDVSARLSANADTLSQARAGHATQAAMGANGAITIHFNPTINAQSGDVGQIETALQIGLREFETLFHRMLAEQQRRAY